ncbi:hypothetical protein DMH04_23735 [Kibdelosporangium aridum]|uniref:Uncharacterized protein n=1 Tax=Kibdelosporangium aridum TaxID=2030 RepID=A0A428Z6U3_KIBAR|nr:hypothetical protein [Kibdelosporangium aridum]RSM83155.1 hypothetical protein DMH04_23735 [Kibdelosporangium aridum]
MLQERIENLEREFDERTTAAAFARCYGVVTAVLTVLMVVPVTEPRRELVIWSVSRGSSSIATWMTLVMLFLVPLLFLLACATIRPGRSPWLGWWIAGFSTVGFVFSIILLSQDDLSTAPAGYVLVVLLFLTVVLGCAHAIQRTRVRNTSPS